jgi:hypothetical protein
VLAQGRARLRQVRAGEDVMDVGSKPGGLHGCKYEGALAWEHHTFDYDIPGGSLALRAKAISSRTIPLMAS